MYSPIQSRVERKKNFTEMDADLNNLQIISTARNINAADKTIMGSTENNIEVDFVSHSNIWNIYIYTGPYPGFFDRGGGRNPNFSYMFDSTGNSNHSRTRSVRDSEAGGVWGGAL